MPTFVDPNTIHDPSTGGKPPASWGDQVRDDLMHLYERGPYICTSSTRPGSPFAGQRIYETDTKKERTYDGTSWWTTGIVGNGTTAGSLIVNQAGVRTSSVTCKYRIINGVCEAWFRIILTAVGSAGNAIFLDLPVQNAQASSDHIGAGQLFRNSASTIYVVSFEVANATQIGMVASTGGTNNLAGATPNFALAINDEIRGHVRYLVASAA